MKSNILYCIGVGAMKQPQQQKEKTMTKVISLREFGKSIPARFGGRMIGSWIDGGARIMKAKVNGGEEWLPMEMYKEMYNESIRNVFNEATCKNEELYPRKEAVLTAFAGWNALPQGLSIVISAKAAEYMRVTREGDKYTYIAVDAYGERKTTKRPQSAKQIARKKALWVVAYR